MDAVAENVDYILELSDIFTLLGKRGKESQRWKKSDRNFWNVMLHLNADLWSKFCGSRVLFRPYGSSAEDLKSEEADDVGDVDLIVFPDSENLLIHEEMIEYLPEHPVHVRIKGADHPVLRFCCVEDSNYVSTSAVQNSHKSIFGPLSSTFPFLFKSLSSENCASVLPFTCRVKNTSMSPALQVDFTLPSEGRNKFSFQQAGTKAKEKTAQRQIEPRDRRENVEVNKEVEEYSDQKEDGKVNDDESELKGKLSLSTAHKDELTSEDLTQRPEGNKEEVETSDIAQLVGRFCEHMFTKENVDKKGKEEKEDAFDEPEFKENELTTEVFRKNDLLAGLDYVPALKSPAWPTVAQEWITRERKWPSPDTVSKVIHEGFHLVVKPPKKGGNPDCDFRISFSHAEYLLSQEMNEIQRECYRCLKKFHRAYLSEGPKSLVTFHLKNILLQTIEDTGAEMWIESNRVACVMKLLSKLVEALTMRYLPHYFVRSYNLFDVDFMEDPEILGTLAEQVRQIIKDPLQFAKKLIQNLSFESKEEDTVEQTVPKSQQASSNKCPASEEGQGDGGTKQTAVGISEAQSKQAEANIQGNSPFSSHKYSELKGSFLAVGKELVDLAFSDHTDNQLAALHPLESSIVQDVKYIAMKTGFSIEYFSIIMDGFFNITYLKLLLSTESNERRRMLDGIKLVTKFWRSLLRQRELGMESNENILVGMFHPAEEDSLALSDFIPAGGGTQLVDMLFSNQSDVDMDIPLD